MLSVISAKFIYFCEQGKLKVNDINNKRNAEVIFHNFNVKYSKLICRHHSMNKPFGCFSLQVKCYNFIHVNSKASICFHEFV